MALSIRTLVCFSVLPFSAGFTVSDKLSPVPFFTVNLDLPPDQRWTHIVRKYPQFVKDAHDIIASFVPPDALPLVEEILADLDNYLPGDYGAEIRGIAKTLNASLGDVVLTNLAYDITAYCTSIIAQDTSGQIWHVRNLDYRSTEMLRNLTIKVDFQRGGKIQYTAITFAGYVGVLTGQKPNAFTVTVDERDQGGWWMNLLIAILDRSAVPLGFLVRDTLQDSPDFSSAVKKLSETDTFADAYFIMGGAKTGEGVVITKDRIDSDDLWYLNQTHLKWFLVETNYDHWLPPPPGDDRRDPAIKAMKAMNQSNVNTKNLFEVISTPPVLNNKTVYTVVMSAATPNIMHGWIRHPDNIN